MMKRKEGRDWLDLSQTVFGVDEINTEKLRFKISDSGATLYFDVKDWNRIKKFVEAALAAQKEKP
jgi:hypothetical protein